MHGSPKYTRSNPLALLLPIRNPTDWTVAIGVSSFPSCPFARPPVIRPPVIVYRSSTRVSSTPVVGDA